MKTSIAVIVLVAASMTASGIPVFAEQETLKYYGKGIADDSSPFQDEIIRTIIDNDKAVVIHQGQNGIEIIRMDISPSDTCGQAKSTFCFVGTVTEIKNTDVHEIGDEVGITLDLENKKQTMSVNSGVMRGIAVTIDLSKTIIKSDEPFIISLTREGGFAGLSGKTITIDSSNGDLSLSDANIDLTDTLPQGVIEKIIKQVKSANLLNIDKSDYPPHPSSADYFVYTLEFTQGVFHKTITWTDTSEGVPKKIVLLRDAMIKISENTAASDQNAVIADIALDFVRESSTFAFDGMEDSLSVGDISVLESFPEQFQLKVSFTSTHGGFGNRDGQIVTQVLTPHVIDILISEGRVISAVTDGQWDEINHQYVLKEP